MPEPYDSLIALADAFDALMGTSRSPYVGDAYWNAARMARQRATQNAQPLPDAETPVSEGGEAEGRRIAYSGPRRGDDTEAWLKRSRDAYVHNTVWWTALDNALDDYRLHADTGTPLREDVPERGEQP